MKIRIASDLHLEAFRGRNMQSLIVDVLPVDSRDAESILVLAGDISADPNQLLEFLHEVEVRFAKVIYIPGNHEYYRHEYHAWNMTMDNRFKLVLKNTLWANDAVGYQEIDGVRFIYATMWADGGHSLEERAKVGSALNDFYIIGFGQATFSVSRMEILHKQQKAAIKVLLQQPFAGPTVVVTHHIPSYSLCHPRFGSDINGGFAAECDDILCEDYAPAIWFYGHTHDCLDKVVGKTRTISNPMGYPREFAADSPFNSYKNGPAFVELLHFN